MRAAGESAVSSVAGRSDATFASSDSIEDQASRAKYNSNKPVAETMVQKRAMAMNENQVPFPPQEVYMPVFNPLNRYLWDLLVLVLIVIVMVVAPFEITYVSETTTLKEKMAPGHRGGPRGCLEP